MRKVLAIVLFLSLLPLANAGPIQIITPGSSILIYAGQQNQIQIPIKNDAGYKDTFYISVWPTAWVNVEKYWVTLEPGQSSSVSLILTPPRDAEEGVRVFSITINSLDNQTSESDSLYVDVKRKTNVFISDIQLNKQIFKPDETLEIKSIIRNADLKNSHTILLTTKILKDNLLIQKFEKTETIQAKKFLEIEQSLPITIHDVYGDYEIEVLITDTLNEFLDEEKTSFKIERVYDVVKYRTQEHGLFYSSVKIDIENKGNVPKSNFSLEESLTEISKYFFQPETEPDLEMKKENRIVYVWNIQGLNPGDSRSIKYRLQFVNIFALCVAGLISIIIIFLLRCKPSMNKKCRGILSEKKRLTISLHIKNKTKKTLKNLEVKDFVPSIAKVMRKFDSLEPDLKRKNIGTELTWKIEKLKPGEERILTYRIEPLIEIVGELKLPKAYFTHQTKKGKDKTTVSKGIFIKTKVK